MIALVISGPLLWSAFDLAVTGDALETAREASEPSVIHSEQSGYAVNKPVIAKGPHPGPLDDHGFLDHGFFHVLALVGPPLALAGIAALIWALWPRRREPPETLAGQRLAAGAALVLLTTLQLERVVGAQLEARYSLALAAISVALVVCAVARLPRRWLLGVAAVLLVGVVAEQPRQFKVLYKQAKTSTKLQQQQLDVGSLADEPAARDAISGCQRVQVGGVGREASIMGRAIVALPLNRDLTEVELRRVPRGPDSSNFRHSLPAPPGRAPSIERGYWAFRSDCLTSPRGSSPSGSRTRSP
ncbi:MAG: hypothetical protein EXQ70_07620 [Solirubrobacterales bacterium]|nr:hypothetical protein [Solirubrobacterales bacterium]